MLPRWYLQTVLGLAVGCAADAATDHDQLQSMITWAVQAATEPLLVQQVNQKTQLDSLSDHLASLTKMVSNLSARQTQLDLLASSQNSTYYMLQPRLNQQVDRIDQLKKLNMSYC